MSEQLKTQSSAPPALPSAPQSSDDEITIDLVDLFYHLAASWKLIVCLALAFALVFAVYTAYFVTPQFRATAIIYVLSPESIVNVSSLQLGTALANDYVKVFDMWEVHEQVLSNLHLDYSYTVMEKMLSVTNTSGTRMLDISVTSPSGAEAAAIANEYAKVASEYIHETMAIDKPSIMSVALEPTKPISPSMVKNVALGFILGAALACVIVFLRFLMDDKLKTPEDIRQYTGLVTLAVVPIEGETSPENESSQKKSGRKPCIR